MRKHALIFGLLALAACKGSEITDPAITTTVVISSNPTQIAVGETAQASAVVKDQNGNPLTGKSITWTSLNQSIATVTSSGLIRGVAPGTATIQGTVDGITGTATIQVVAPVNVCSSAPAEVSLSTGQVRVLNVLDIQGCVKVVAGEGQPQYLVIAANTSAVPDAFPTFVLRSDLGETVPAGNLLATPSRIAASLAVTPRDPALDLQSGFETKLRGIERDLDLRRAQRDYAETRGLRPRYSVNAAALPAVGEKTQFRIPGTTESCTQFKTITATARYVGTRAIMYTDDASPSGGFTDSELQTIATEFDNLIYPTGIDYFGTPLDLDENSRIVILYTPEVNRLTPSGNPDSFIGGFFFAGDLFPATSCPQTNRAELFYVLAPDPNGTINGNKRTTAAVRQGTRGTIAHEFQHMINASERIRHPVTSDLEAVWLDEALAHFAEDLNGRVLRSLNETGNYTFEQLTNNSTQVNDYNAFFFQNFARLTRYLQNTGPNSPTSQHVDSSLADRGAAWALLRYAADHHAPNGDVKAFIKSLVPGPDTGVVNLRTKAGNVAFDSLATGWMVANFADDAGIPGLAAKHTYRTYNMRSNLARVNSPSQTFPLVPTLLNASPFSATLQVRSASGAYFRFVQPAGGPSRIFRFTNSDLKTAATFSGATLVFLRTQ
jgi:hypothetical protein